MKVATRTTDPRSSFEDYIDNSSRSPPPEVSQWMQQLAEMIYSSDNTLYGGLGFSSDALFGHGGNDTLYGLGGNDFLYGGEGNDTLFGGEGSDQLYGENGNDTLYGGDGRDEIYGGGGNDTLDGGGDNDLLYGGESDDHLSGGDGNDYLEGGSGSDYLAGDAGNDGIIAGDGNDTLDGGIGDDSLYGGNGEDVLVGGAGSDDLHGDAGNDILYGGEGNDTLFGGEGADTYLFALGDGRDTLRDYDSTRGNTDAVNFLSGVAANQIWLRHVANDLEVSIIGTNDKLTIENWYSGSAYHVEQFKTSDGKALLDTRVETLVQAMAAFSPPAAGQTTLPQPYQAALASVIAANWQ